MNYNDWCKHGENEVKNVFLKRHKNAIFITIVEMV